MLLSSALAILPFGFLALDSLRVQVGVDAFHQAGIKGKGILIGLNETVDYSLWDFRHPDGSTRFLRYMGKGPRELDSLLRVHYPENRHYPYRDGWQDSLRIHNYLNFHGTAVLAIAAGNGQSKGYVDLGKTYVGMAPEADLMVGDYWDVKAFADSLGRPFVFNHSYQSNIGVHPDSSTAGKIAVLSAGNAHNFAAVHRFLPGDTTGLSLRFRPASREFHRVDDSTYLYDLLIRIWYPDSAKDSILSIAIRSPNDTLLRYRVNVPAREDVDDTVRGVLRENNPTRCSGDSVPLFEWVDIGRQYSFRWGPHESPYGLRYRVRTRAFRDFTIHINRTTFRGDARLVLPSEAVSHDCCRYIQAEEFRDSVKGSMTWLAYAGDGNLPDLDAIHVGSFARHVEALDPVFQRAGDIAYYSGRGDIAGTGVVKPEIAAPAHHIVSLAAHGHYGWGGYTLADSIHGTFDGTSAAAPVISGAVALLLQMDPTLDDDAVRAILRENARTDGFTGAVPNDAWGYGKFHLDLGKVRARLAQVSTGRPRPGLRAAGPVPNPFRGRTRIEWIDLEPDPRAFLEVRDLQGRLLLRAPPQALKGRLAWEVDGSAWPAGVYPYRVHTRAGDLLGKLIRAD